MEKKDASMKFYLYFETKKSRKDNRIGGRVFDEKGTDEKGA